MALSVVQSNSDFGGPSTNPHQSWTPVSGGAHGNPTPGNLLLCLVTWNQNLGAATCTMPAGWVKAAEVSVSNTVHQVLFYKTATDPEVTKVQATLSASKYWAISLCEVHSTAASGWLLDRMATKTGSGTAPETGTTLATTASEEFWAAGISSQNKATLTDPTNGFAIVQQENSGDGSDHISHVLLDKIVAATDFAFTAGTYDTSVNWVGLVAAFKCAPKTVTAAGGTLEGGGTLLAHAYHAGVELVVQAAFGHGASDPDPVWTDITGYCQSCSWQRGRQNELNEVQAGTATVVLNDPLSHWDPGNTGSYIPAVLADTPRGYWRLGEAAGRFQDIAGGHTANPHGGVAYGATGATGDGDSAVTLDGTGYMLVYHHADFNTGDVFSLECWVNISAAPSVTAALIDKYTGSYRLEIDTNQTIAFWCLGVGKICGSSSLVPADGAWHHIVATKNGAAAHLYLDGADVTGAVTDRTVSNNANHLQFSAQALGLVGGLDEVAIYPTVLTPARVAAHYAAATAGGSPFWPHVKPGLPVRAMLFAGANLYSLFYGFAERLPRTQRVTDVYTQRQLDLTDGFALLSVAGLGGNSYGEETSDERVHAVANNIGWPEKNRRVGSGASLLQEIAFPGEDDTRAQTHFQQVSDSENGLLYVDGANTLVFVGRHELLTDEAYTLPKAAFVDVEPPPPPPPSGPWIYTKAGYGAAGGVGVGARVGGTTSAPVAKAGSASAGLVGAGSLGYGIDAYTVLMLHCDGTDTSTTFTDSALTPHTMVAHINAQVDTAQSVFGGASMFLDVTSWVTSADSADWGPGAGDFTFDCRVRFNSTSGQQTLVAHWVASGNQKGWMIAQDFNVGGLYFDYTTDGATEIYPNFAWSPSVSTWYHVAVVRTGTVVRAFVDGTQIGSDHSIGASTVFNSTSELAIGVRDSVATSFPLNGWLDEIRISKGIARWTANFTPPARPYKA